MLPFRSRSVAILYWTVNFPRKKVVPPIDNITGSSFESNDILKYISAFQEYVTKIINSHDRAEYGKLRTANVNFGNLKAHKEGNYRASLVVEAKTAVITALRQQYKSFHIKVNPDKIMLTKSEEMLLDKRKSCFLFIFCNLQYSLK